MTRPRFESLVAGVTIMSLEADRRPLELLMVEMLSHRSAEATMCPSEVARAASPDGWRILMPAVRLAACRLAAEQCIEITQGGKAIGSDSSWRGPVRLGRGTLWGNRVHVLAGV